MNNEKSVKKKLKARSCKVRKGYQNFHPAVKRWSLKASVLARAYGMCAFFCFYRWWCARLLSVGNEVAMSYLSMVWLDECLVKHIHEEKQTKEVYFV